MTIWEKTVVNLQKGSRKIAATAAFFSERVKAEISIVRLKIRIDEEQRRVDELYRSIGRKIVDLKRKGSLPKTSEQMLGDEDIAAAMTELSGAEQEIEHLKDEIKSISTGFATAENKTEDSAA